MKKETSYHYLPFTIKSPTGRSIDHIIKLKKQAFKLYCNAQHKLFLLSPLERSFYEYLVEKMDTRARILIDNNLKSEYILFIEKVANTGNKPLTTARIAQIVTKLKELGLILASSDRGLYYINPKYVHKGPEKRRLTNLRDIIHEFIFHNLPINMLIDVKDEMLDAS